MVCIQKGTYLLQILQEYKGGEGLPYHRKYALAAMAPDFTLANLYLKILFIIAAADLAFGSIHIFTRYSIIFNC
jgi:hypothetical protein